MLKTLICNNPLALLKNNTYFVCISILVRRNNNQIEKTATTFINRIQNAKPMTEKFADIHCHSTTKAFYRQRGPAEFRLDPFQTAPNRFTSNFLNKLKDFIERTTELKLGTQSNFDNLFAGGHRVAIISLTPPEKAFFVLNQRNEKLLTTELKAFAEFNRVPYKGTIRNDVVNAFTGFSSEDIANCKLTGLDYYDDLLVPEYKFLESFNNKKGKGGYTLKLVHNYEEIETFLKDDPNTLCVIVSVEGAHSLGKSPGYGDILKNQSNPHTNDQDRLGATTTTTQDYVLNIESMKQWEYPPLFISLYHHVWNELGGHARSLNRMINILINQDEGMNLGINPTGLLVLRQLLSKENGKRILIDVKHMSPRSRKDYYQLLKTDDKLKAERIPIICSHTGVVTKRNTIEEMIRLADHEDLQELDSKSNYLHECSINLCAEDINIINDSRGLIGIELDEKRIAGKEIIKIIQGEKAHTEEQVNIQYAKVLLANIFRIVQVINKREGWDIICIGSDFDGLINHLDCCPTSEQVPVLKKNMLAVLESESDISQQTFNYEISRSEIQTLLFGYSPIEALEKVFYNNVIDFLKEHF